ncbi:MAG: hypothetical protein HQK71_09845, partial [Desulfamplus sp.]|nr:hypothetical protein [Desulfamplus sp.]
MNRFKINLQCFALFFSLFYFFNQDITWAVTPSVKTTEHSIALKSDGSVWAWGVNESGQLGNGTTTDSSVPVQVKDSSGTGFLTNITAISTNTGFGGHSVALKSDGTVWAWGNNYRGQLGNGTTGVTPNPLPVQVKDSSGTGFLTNIIAIDAGSNYVIALKNDGTVWGWGECGSGQIGTGHTGWYNLPQQVVDSSGTGFLTNIIAIDAGAEHTVALKNDGTVWAWGGNIYYKLGDSTNVTRTLPVQVKDPSDGSTFLTGVSAIAAGQDSTVVLKSDGTVWAWGHNLVGNLGDGTTTDRINPVQVKDTSGTGFLTGISAIAASNGHIQSEHVIALKNDGTVFTWGFNGRGQLGNGTTTGGTPNPLPVQVKDPTGTSFLTGVSSITAGTFHSIAVKSDGSVLAWGKNDGYNLLDGTVVQKTLPVYSNIQLYFPNATTLAATSITTTSATLNAT